MYKEYGRKFADKLNNAISNMFTFLRHPGMDLINNLAEHILRQVIIVRKVRNSLLTTGGIKMFGILITYVLTWRRRGINTTEKLLEILGST